MNTKQARDRAGEILRDTDHYVRENPVPVILGAVAVGFIVGLAVRSLEHERKAAPIQDALDDLRTLLLPIAKRGRKAYAHATDAMRDAAEQAAGRVRDIDLDDYAEPMAGWWRRIWS